MSAIHSTTAKSTVQTLHIPCLNLLSQTIIVRLFLADFYANQRQIFHRIEKASEGE